MQLYGLLKGLDGETLQFAPDLRSKLDDADKIYNGINASIDKFIAQQNMDAPPASVYAPVWQPNDERTALNLREANITAIVWCIGFTPDFSWLDVPVFSGRGNPSHTRGVTHARGLYFLGLPWLHTWGSGRFSGVARDAKFLADRIEIAQQRAKSLAPLLEMAA